jgi:hypothetical protein
MAGLFDNVLENSVNTGLQNNLKESIENAGVRIPASTCLWQYPKIIRDNLVSKTVTGINILGGDVINITTQSDGNTLTYNISTVFDTFGKPRPNYAWENTKWGKEITVKDAFDDLFNNILPAVRGVHAGDITMSDISGNDKTEWNNTLFNVKGLKTGLLPTSRYIRLYLTSQAEPIYIHIGNLIEELTNGYNVQNSDTVSFELDDENRLLYAHVNIINDEQLKELGI